MKPRSSQRALIGAALARWQPGRDAAQRERDGGVIVPSIQVMNRSDLPIYDVCIDEPVSATVGTIRPGDVGRLHFEFAVLHEMQGSAATSVSSEPLLLKSWQKEGRITFTFVDAANQRWIRHGDGRLEVAPNVERRGGR